MGSTHLCRLIPARLPEQLDALFYLWLELAVQALASIGANAPKYVVLHAIDSDFYIVISSEDSEVLIRPINGSFDIIFRARLEARADFGLLKTKKARIIASILVNCDLAKGLHGIGWVKLLVNDKLVALANRDWQVGEDAAMADALRDALGKEERQAG
ncbi:hypothetical protein JCM10296v2_002918 [Rhodotorula toruloides]